LINLFIDDIKVSVLKNSTVLQACDSLGIDIPRFCFHERLLIAGNCRMCLVEIEKSPKPVASCALPVMEGMKIFTNTPLVKKAQEGILEFLLLNHPLDCPICDQGGECDLQDQAVFFGSDSSRFYEYKRGVEDKNCGPLIKTIMTRCIHCTRCVRFSSEISGIPELGTLGRGTNTQIGTFVDKTLSSELSGNMIDLCPVGALTSKPYAFKARSWELQNINSIDVSDSCGSNIVLGVKGREIMRILPRLNENINEEWISDKSRFSYDGLKIQRIGVPLFLNSDFKNLIFKEITWEDSFKILLSNIFLDIYNLENKINIFIEPDTDLETVLVLKHFFNQLNCFSIYSNENFDTNSSDIFYKFSEKMKNISDYDFCVLVNCNTRFESSMLNLHLRKAVRQGSLKVCYFGNNINLTYKASHLGLNKKSFFDFIKGKHFFSTKLKLKKKPLFIINSNAFTNDELLSINQILLENLSIYKNFLNILNLEANSTGLREIGVKSISNFNFNFDATSNLYININKVENNELFNNKLFSIYLGTHGVPGLSFMNLILPSKSFVEKESRFLNLEGLMQQTNKAVNGLGNSRDDWKIITAFFQFLSLNSIYNNILNINFVDIISLYKFFGLEYKFLKNSKNLYNDFIFFNFNKKNILLLENSFIFKSKILNFYKTNILSMFSQIMTECSQNMRRLNFLKNK
jgi:NADH dehydrogenase (ubiquinone) Fe-S protein 1